MQQVYLDKLSHSVRTFVEAVEEAAGVPIEVEESAELNDGGPAGQGNLKVDIGAQYVRLYVPSNGYFPDGGVRHEVLHVHRLHIDGVPRLALAEDVAWAPSLEQGLVRVDNALEHLAIVPVELQHHPERVAHWEAVMTRMWQVDIPEASALDRRVAAGLHWSFLRHVIPGSPAVDTAIAMMNNFGLRAEAEAFSALLLPLVGSKTELVRTFFDWFPEVPRDQASLAYLNVITGTTYQSIPDK